MAPSQAITDAGLAAVGVTLTLYAYSALKPGDLPASGLPAVVFSLVADNAGADPVNVSLTLTLPLPAMNDCARPAAAAAVVRVLTAPSPAACLHACAGVVACASWTHVNATGACTLASSVPWSVFAAGSYCGVAGAWVAADGGGLSFEQTPAGGAGGPAYGDATLLPVLDGGGGAACVGTADSASALLAEFAATGCLGGAPGGFAPAAIGGAVASGSVPAGGAAAVSVVFAWYFPHRDHMNVDIGNFYANLWASSGAVAGALGSRDALAGAVSVINAHHAVFAPLAASPLPDWVSDFAINEMSHFRGLIWTRDGRLREFEANDCPDVDSIHNDYQRHLPYLWVAPQFEVREGSAVRCLHPGTRTRCAARARR